MCVCVCVCVCLCVCLCACVREREREREYAGMIIDSVCMCSGTEVEKLRERQKREIKKAPAER